MTPGCLDTELGALLQRFPDRPPERKEAEWRGLTQRERETQLCRGDVSEFRLTDKIFEDMRDSLHQLSYSVEPLPPKK